MIHLNKLMCSEIKGISNIAKTLYYTDSTNLGLKSSDIDELVKELLMLEEDMLQRFESEYNEGFIDGKFYSER